MARPVFLQKKKLKMLLPVSAVLMIAAGLFLSEPQAADTAAAQVDYDEAVFSFIGDVAEAVSPAVVSIRSLQGEDPATGIPVVLGTGSGVIFSAEGYIVTNYHVIGGAKTIQVSLADGRQDQAVVVNSYPASDLALLKVGLKDLPVAVLGDSDKVHVGDLAFAIGNPGGEQFARSLTMGVISGVERQLLLSDGYEYNLLQTDAAINPGNSGGPLVDCHGCVIGINSVKIVDADFEGMGFAIPINTVRQVLEEDDPDLFLQAAFAKEK